MLVKATRISSYWFLNVPARLPVSMLCWGRASQGFVYKAITPSVKFFPSPACETDPNEHMVEWQRADHASQPEKHGSIATLSKLACRTLHQGK